MDLQQMRYVVGIAETGSFTRAAARNFVVQSALSHQIAALERELGVQLFVRSSRQVRLTEAGEAFLPHARAALDAADRARNEAAAAQGTVRGTLRIGVIPTVTAVDLPAVLRECRTRFPELVLAARVANSEEMIAEVRAGTLDIGFLGLLDGTRVEGVAQRVLTRDTLTATLAPEHPLATRDRLSLADLADEPFADFPRTSAGRKQSDAAFARAGVERQVAYELGSMDLTRELIVSGLAVALLPSRYAAAMPGVVVVPLVEETVRHEILIWDRLHPSPAARAFTELVAELRTP
ncbi:LysR family transcriptional regulator [Arthrobacter woluwensis]|uniref:LysR family transcriptional regulator n=1 Tax=Arthrobacter woluwensis TaxID=156980 RepID=UPI001AFB2E8A|nr:LysR family transcriptional regulator [Arthrobacter woluwensis]QTF73144.1 LysR family transcriptional regulator [Arthrobacter woluwensis]